MTDEQWIRTKQNCAPDEVEQEETIENKENIEQKEPIDNIKPNNFIIILVFLTVLFISVISIGVIKYKEGFTQNTYTITVGDTGGPK